MTSKVPTKRPNFIFIGVLLLLLVHSSLTQYKYWKLEEVNAELWRQTENLKDIIVVKDSVIRTAFEIIENNLEWFRKVTPPEDGTIGIYLFGDTTEVQP